jgi:hypothetical protein
MFYGGVPAGGDGRRFQYFDYDAALAVLWILRGELPGRTRRLGAHSL